MNITIASFVASNAAVFALSIGTASAATIVVAPLAPANAVALSTHRTCAAPRLPATVAYDDIAEYPAIARVAHVTGTSDVRVDLDATGRLERASLYRSSGNASLDRAALAAARNETYAPEVRDCSRVGGAYVLEVDFDGE